MTDARLKEKIKAEIEGLKKKVRALEEKLSLLEKENEGGDGLVKVRAARKPMHANIEFIGDFDLLEAEGVDISDSGICFELHTPLPFDMQFEQDGQRIRKHARLIWVKQLEGDRSRLGLHFIDTDDPDSIIKKIES